MKNYFLLVCIVLANLLFIKPVEAFSIDQFHTNVGLKYGVKKSQLTVQRVVRPRFIDKVQRQAEQTRQKLEKFANTLDSNPYQYRLNEEYWRLLEDDRVLSYTYSIDIIKANKKTFDYYCWTVLSKIDDSGMTMGCSAFEVE